jgi:hypothetical protein
VLRHGTVQYNLYSCTVGMQIQGCTNVQCTYIYSIFSSFSMKGWNERADKTNMVERKVCSARAGGGGARVRVEKGGRWCCGVC